MGVLGAPPSPSLCFKPGSGTSQRCESAEQAQAAADSAEVLGPRQKRLVRRSGSHAVGASATVPARRGEQPCAEVAANIATRRGRPGGQRSGRRPGFDFSAAGQYARQYARPMGRRGTMHPSRHPENPGKFLILLLGPHWSRYRESRRMASNPVGDARAKTAAARRMRGSPSRGADQGPTSASCPPYLTTGGGSVTQAHG
jgi:hypothetical protein